MDIEIYRNVLTMMSKMVNLMRRLKLNLEFVEKVYYLIFLNRNKYQGKMYHLAEDFLEYN
jgi:hypothetical protein